MGPKKIEKIKITRKKEHSPLITPHPPSQEPDPPSPQEPDLDLPSPQEPDLDIPSPSSHPHTESHLIKEKLLTLLESKDEDYLIDFIYEFMLIIKEREEEIEKADPEMWTLIQELKEMIKE